MPIVAVAPVINDTDEILRTFTDSVGTSPVTYTYLVKQEKITVTNKGASHLILTVGVMMYTIPPNRSQTVVTPFTEFIIYSTNGVQSFDAISDEVEYNTNSTQQEQEIFTKIKDHSNQLGNLSGQLVENAKQIQFPSVKRVKQPLVTFSDDDGQPMLITKLKPLALQKNIPIAAALYAQSPAFTNNLSDLIDLQNNHGWEFCSHTKDHVDITTMTDQQLRDDCKYMINLLDNSGLKCKTFVYPYGAWNYNTCKIVSEYFRSGISSSSGAINGYPLDTYGIKRVSFGLDMLDFYKSQVDLAVTNKAWCIFELHIQQMSDDQLTILGQLIDYVQSISVPIVTFDQAMDLIGNRLDINQKALNTNGDYFIIDCEGRAYYSPKSIPTPLHALGTKTGIDNSTLIDGFENLKETFIYYSSGDAAGFPTQGGTLITNRITGNNYAAYQIWFPYDVEDIYRRRWNQAGNAWYAWERIVTKSYLDTRLTTSEGKVNYVTAAMNSYTAAQLASAYPWKVVTFPVNSSGSTGFPGDSAGIVTTYHLQGNGWDRQEFSTYLTNEKWIRYVDGTGSWTPWLKIGGGSGTTANRPTTAYVGYPYFDTTLGKPIWLKTAPSTWVDATGTVV